MRKASEDLGSAKTQSLSSPPERSHLPSKQLESGLPIGHYELIRLLGKGGMGQVYLARDTKLGRKVAIKFVRAASERVATRFLVEARATARCNHENIVVIHEVNEYEGRPYMVLEYLEGQSLADWLRGRQLPPVRAVELCIPVVKALVRAHEYNIVHRDLKPQNVVVLDSGVVKVVDFGIAKVLGDSEPQQTARDDKTQPVDSTPVHPLTRKGAALGTMQYMAPEQWEGGEVDGRADIWAVGMLLYEMVAGKPPFAGFEPMQLAMEAGLLDRPVPSVREAAPKIPVQLEQIIERCLAKRAKERFASAAELLEALQPLRPGNLGRELAEDESPFPGLAPFQEADAARFFGRRREIMRATALVRDRPLVGVAGPSGAGKSSFVRAGLIPALKVSGEAWDVLTVRPGRNPFGALANLLQPITHSPSSDLQDRVKEHEALQRRLREEPGYLGAVLRQHVRQRDVSVMVFVDQFEELYTLVPDVAERAAFTACLAGVADDAAAPLRVVVAMRSDFLDRAAENQRFVEELMRGLIFLQTPDRDGLREAITQPLEMAGYRFEDDSIADQMLDELEATQGALPLLQFAVATLWEARDRQGQVLTARSFRAMGGVAGALSTHADTAVAALPLSDQKIMRAVLQRLVTAEGTRAIVDMSELLALQAAPQAVQRVVDYLVEARLLVVQKRSEAAGPIVEIVHESLIHTWPTLRRWSDEDKDATAFLEHLRNTAKQWAAKGRPRGLLWTDDAEEEARFWSRSYLGELTPLEQEYLDAVFALSERIRRRRRWQVSAAIIVLSLIAVGAIVALLLIRQAERRSAEQARIARQAERRISEQLELIQRKERQRSEAEKAKRAAEAAVSKGEQKLKRSYSELEKALKRAEAEKERALAATAAAQAAAQRIRELADSEKKARETAEELLARERRRLKKLQRLKSRITTDLNLK